MKKLIPISILLFALFSCGDDPIAGNSYEGFFIMDSECGCNSKNQETKREKIWEEKYDNHRVMYLGTVSRIDGNVLSFKSGVSSSLVDDVDITFDDESVLFDLKLDSYIVVEFVLRGQGGCFTNYDGDNGRIVSNSFDNNEEYNNWKKNLEN